MNNKTIYFIYADNRAISGELLSTGMTTQRRKKCWKNSKTGSVIPKEDSRNRSKLTMVISENFKAL